ncbi:hypothetical protein C8J56DRAFT_952980 [Mycena floridula]|nr:hypothetical protein C8J56DRAFT_952980 [Mycena floridula]
MSSGRASLPVSPRFSSMTKKEFKSLDKDSLEIIAEMLWNEPEEERAENRRGLESLFLVGWMDVRDIAMRVMFREFIWEPKWDPFPLTLWPYFRKFTISITDDVEQYACMSEVIAEHLTIGFPEATILQHVRFSGADIPFGTSSGITKTLCLVKQLSTLEFVGFRWSIPVSVNPAFTLPTGLKNLIYHRKHDHLKWSGLPRDGPLNHSEAQSLFALITASADTLENIILPSELTLLAELGSTSWPELRKLELSGFPPAFPYQPWCNILQSPPRAPVLQSLTFRISHIYTDKSKFLVFPPPAEGSTSSTATTGPDKGVGIRSSKIVATLSEIIPTASETEEHVEESLRENDQSLVDSSTAFDCLATSESPPLPGPALADLAQSAQLEVDQVEGEQVLKEEPEGLDRNSTATEEITLNPLGAETILSPLHQSLPAATTRPSLISLHVSNPQEEDLLWDNIPDTVQELSLLCYPNHSIYRTIVQQTKDGQLDDVADMFSIPSQKLINILRRIPTQILTTLRISFWEGENDFVAFDFLASACPMLQVLDVRRHSLLDNDDDGTLQKFSMEDLHRLCRSLKTLEHLRELKLDIVFPDTVAVYFGEEPKVLLWKSFYLGTLARAKLIFEILPQLTAIGLSCLRGINHFYWMMFENSESGLTPQKIPEFDEKFRIPD